MNIFQNLVNWYIIIIIFYSYTLEIGGENDQICKFVKFNENYKTMLNNYVTLSFVMLPFAVYTLPCNAEEKL